MAETTVTNWFADIASQRYTSSFGAFPEDTYAAVLGQSFGFCNRVLQDQQSQLSYSCDSHAMTLDPVSTRNPEWARFKAAYNQFWCRRRWAIAGRRPPRRVQHSLLAQTAPAIAP